MYLNIIEIFTKLWASKYAQYLHTISGAQQGSKHQYLPNTEHLKTFTILLIN